MIKGQDNKLKTYKNLYSYMIYMDLAPGTNINLHYHKTSKKYLLVYYFNEWASTGEMQFNDVYSAKQGFRNILKQLKRTIL